VRPNQLILPAAVVVGIAYWSVVRPWHFRWGATDAEVGGSYPGDDLIARAGPVATHAVTIEAPAEAIWPWLAQLGQHRGGFYSYTCLENLLGCRMRNAPEIVPEWQHVAVDDPVWLHPQAPPMRVALVEPGKDLVLVATTPAGAAPAGAAPAPGTVFTTWGFHLRPVDGQRTRLIARLRADPDQGLFGHRPSPAERFGNALFWEPAHFAMERKMLLEIRTRAEAGLRSGAWSPVLPNFR